MPFKVFFSIFNSGGHCIQRSGTILAILVEGHQKKYFYEIILKSVHYSRRRFHLNVFCFLFLFLTLAAILFSVAERF